MEDNEIKLNAEGIVLFAYNFPHRKTQDFIFRLLTEGINIKSIIAADAVKLNIPNSTIKTKVRHTGLVHPKLIAERFDIDYFISPHNSEESVEKLNEMRPSIGLIAGARILSEKVINTFSKGIINFHPGLIPESRGLDALLWSILNDIPLGVTAHKISKEIDAGEILLKEHIDIFEDDTIFDLSERLYETQLDMIRESVKNLSEEKYLGTVGSGSSYNKKMPGVLEKKVEQKAPDYIKRFITVQAKS